MRHETRAYNASAMRAALVVVITGIVAAGAVIPDTAHAERKRRKKAETELENVAEARSRFVVLTDGEGIYVVVDPSWTDEHWLFSGDGKTFYRQRVFSSGKDG